VPGEQQRRFERRFLQVVNGYLDGEYAGLAERFRACLEQARSDRSCSEFAAIHFAARYLRLEDPALYDQWLEVNRKSWAAATLLEGGSPFYYA
jgi:hypothetical protein